MCSMRRSGTYSAKSRRVWDVKNGSRSPQIISVGTSMRRIRPRIFGHAGERARFHPRLHVPLDLLGGEAAEPCQRAAEDGVAEAAHDELRQPGRMEQQLVLGAPLLPRGTAHLAQVGHWMRRVEDDQAAHQLGIEHPGQPGHRAAPVVPCDDARPFADLRDHAGDVFGELGKAIGIDRARLRRIVVPAQIDGDDMEAGRGQRRNLIPIRIPELGEAVQEHDQRSLPGLDIVDGDVTDLARAIGDVQLRNQRHQHIVWGNAARACSEPAHQDSFGEYGGRALGNQRRRPCRPSRD